MKALGVISLLGLFLYIQLFNGAVWVSYEINKSEIIQKFCENKEEPQLKCEGKCHMKKMMLTEETEDEEKILIQLPEILLYLNSNEIFGQTFAEVSDVNPYHEFFVKETFMPVPHGPPEV